MTKTNFKGKLTKDAEFSVTPNGMNLYKFSLAVSTKKPKMDNGQPVLNAQGKPEFEVIFVDFTAFAKVAESIVNGSLHPFMAKGAFVNVDARFDGVNAYMKQDNKPGASANFVIESFLDLSLISQSFNQRADGATYNPPARQNTQQGGGYNPPQNQQGGFNNGGYGNLPQDHGNFPQGGY